MRTGHMGLKVITALAILVSGCLLLYQVQDSALAMPSALPARSAALISLIVIAAAAVCWTRRVNAHRTATVGLGMLGTQFVLLLATGVALEAAQPMVPGAQLVAPLTDGLTVLLAALIALAAWAPLRALFDDQRGRRRAMAVRARTAALSRQGVSAPRRTVGADQGFVVGVTEATRASGSAGKAGGRSDGEPETGEAPTDIAADGDVQIPAALIFSQLHQRGIIDQAVLNRVPADLAVNTPIASVAQGLREGEILLPLSALSPSLPRDLQSDSLAAESDEIADEPMIIVPLETVVPQIPKEAFVIPQVRLPEWMSLDSEEEEEDSTFVASTLSLVQESDSDGIG